MTVAAVIAITVIALLALLAVKFPIAIALGVSGALGLVLLQGFEFTSNALGSEPFTQTYNFSFTIVPMFILMGMFALRARVAEYFLAIAAYATRRLPGGLGVATVMACAGFAAVSGSSIGTVATMSQLSVGEMRKHGYPASLATGLVAIAGTVGILIPPSTFLVFYAIITQSSVAQMLAAGIVPGLLSFIAYAIYIITIGSRQIGRSKDVDDLKAATAKALDEAHARVGADGSRVDDVTWRTLPWRGLVYFAILFGTVLGGMYSGIFTATESAAIGAIASVVILVFERRGLGAKGLLRQIRDSLLDTGGTTAMLFFIIIGSTVFSLFIVMARIPEAVTAWVDTLGLPPFLMMAILLAMLIPLGMFLEELSLLLITVPILWPIGVEFAVDLVGPEHAPVVTIWLGVLIVKLMEVGIVMPPVGINSFVAAAASRVRTETVFKGILPFFVIDLILLVILYLVPELSLFLPSLVSPTAG